LTLARPADKIQIAEILELAHRVRPTSNHPAWITLANLKQAERDAADNKTLADLNQVFQSD
jgi:membrane protein